MNFGTWRVWACLLVLSLGVVPLRWSALSGQYQSADSAIGSALRGVRNGLRDPSDPTKWLTQSAAAMLCGVPVGAISDIENGRPSSSVISYSWCLRREVAIQYSPQQRMEAAAFGLGVGGSAIEGLDYGGGGSSEVDLGLVLMAVDSTMLISGLLGNISSGDLNGAQNLLDVFAGTKSQTSHYLIPLSLLRSCTRS